MVAPYNGLSPATTVNIGLSIALTCLFAAIGLVTLVRSGRAALLR
jgi:hypothetical protein